VLEAMNAQQHEPQLADATSSNAAAATTVPAGQSQVTGLSIIYPLSLCVSHKAAYQLSWPGGLTFCSCSYVQPVRAWLHINACPSFFSLPSC